MIFARLLIAPVLAGSLALTAGPASAATFTKLVDFFQQPTGAASPLSGAFFYHGALYGTTQSGGAYNSGAIYTYKPGRRRSIVNQVTLIHSFHNGSNGLGNDITGPQGEPALVGTILYGTGVASGSVQAPGVYSYDLSTGNEQLLYAFPVEYLASSPNGVIMVGKTLFGTTSTDGGNLNGTIFSVDPANGKQKTLYAFAGGADGGAPYGGLTDVGGLLYGTTSAGGAKSAGTIFSFDPATNTKTTLYSFAPATDGAQPRASMILANNLLYGTTYAGGPGNAGGVFSFNPATGAEVPLHILTSHSEGQNPIAPLLEQHGKLYGTASAGGPGGQGTVFEIHSKTGHFTLLHAFSGADGSGPAGALHVHQGNIYGTTFAGGAFNTGSIFEVTQ